MIKDVQRECLWGLKVFKTPETFRFQAIPIYIQQNFYEYAMANN